MKIIGVIPARYGSSRFPGKPLAMIQGKPMVVHVYERACRAKNLSDVVIATDDKRILLEAARFGAHAVMTRVDHASGSDRIAEVADSLEVDVVVNIQGDEPLIEPDMIDQVVEPLLEDTSAPMATLKKKITSQDDLKNPNIVKVITDNHGYAIYFSRACIPFPKKGWKEILEGKLENMPEGEFFRHIGIYAYRKDFLLQYTKMPAGRLEHIEELEQLRVLENGFKIKVAETEYETISVDAPEDIEKVLKNINS